MPAPHIVFDIETILDREALARAHQIDPADDAAIKEALAEEFPKVAFHKIVAIAATAFTYDIHNQEWSVLDMASIHAGRFRERELISRFVDYVECMQPVLVGYNSAAFDVPVVRARAMMHKLRASHLVEHGARRYRERHLDLCDVLVGRGRGRLTLDEAARAFGVGAKMEGMDGGKVEDLAAEGKYDTVADYCLDDVVATAGLFLLHETLSGRLDEAGFHRDMGKLTKARTLTLQQRPDSFIHQRSGFLAGPSLSIGSQYCPLIGVQD